MSLDKLLISLGIAVLLFSSYLFWQRYSPQRLSFDSVYISTANSNKSNLKPVRITIPAIDLDLPIIPSVIKDNKWESTTKGVSYLSSSPIPGAEGNSILYGHDWPNLLGNINKLKPGQIIKIRFSDNSLKEFKVYTTSLVSPSQVSILAPSKTPQITLYTCYGFFDNKRFVVVAK